MKLKWVYWVLTGLLAAIYLARSDAAPVNASHCEYAPIAAAAERGAKEQ